MDKKRCRYHLAAASEGNPRDRDYWLTKLSGELTWTIFPPHHKCPGPAGEEKAAVHCTLDSTLYGNMMKLVNHSDPRLHMVFVAAITLLLNKYTGHSDVILGVPIYKQAVEGNFVNTVLVLRNQITPVMIFKELILRVRQTLVQAAAHQSYPLELLMEELNIAVPGQGPALSAIAVMLKNIHHKSYLQPADPLMIFNFLRKTNRIELTVEYKTSHYRQGGTAAIVSHLVQLLRLGLADVNTQLADIEIVTRKEKAQLLLDFNDTGSLFPRDITIHQLFVRQVERIPDATAAVYGPHQVSYHHLDLACNRLAQILGARGMKPGEIAAVMMHRSMEMLVTLLGILKAGGAYLPIDPLYPRARGAMLIRDSASRLLVTNTGLDPKTGGVDEVILLDRQDLWRGDVQGPGQSCAPANLAYVIYTSGSSGTPKGVMVEHRSVVNILLALNKNYPLDPPDVYLFKTSYGFDVSVTELFGWFPGGGRIALLEKETEKSPQKIIEAIEKQTITHINFVPSMFAVFVKYLDRNNIGKLSGLKYIFLAGEVLPQPIVKGFALLNPLNTGIQLVNLYGPTETAVYSCAYPLKSWNKEDAIPIGRPMDNIKCYILDTRQHLVPMGVAGELCISGVCTGRGYLNNMELTADKFIDNPFGNKKDTFSRLYRTGDIARWLTCGNIEFLGRRDHQVKIRGFRIELGEIERQLVTHPGVTEAQVLAPSNENSNKYLVAYIVWNPGEKMPEKETASSVLKEYLARRLPYYMVPLDVVFLDKMPLAANGKIHRKALEAVSRITPGLRVNYEAPQNRWEETLVSLWKKAFSRKERIGVNHGFFELGGDSLVSASLVWEIHKKLDVWVPLAEFYKRPTIKELAAYISHVDKNIYSAVESTEDSEYSPAAPAQKRVFIACQLKEEGNNMPVILTIRGSIDKKQLQTAFSRLVNRHPSLRTAVEIIDSRLVQRVKKVTDFKMNYRELTELAESHPPGENRLNRFIHRFIRPFELTRPPLFRVELVKLDRDNHLLMMDTHHIVSDGMSLVILMKDLSKLYNGEPLPLNRIHYKDYVRWQCRMLNSTEMDRQYRYWLDQYKGDIPVLEMPGDYPGQALVNNDEYRNITLRLPGEMLNPLRSLAKAKEVSLFMVLLAGYYVLLYKYTGQEDIVVGTPEAGRPHGDFQDVVGMFVHPMALRNKPKGHKTFIQFLHQVKVNLLDALENQMVQFEDLAEKLNIKRDPRGNLLFNTIFMFLTVDLGVLRLGNARVDLREINQKIKECDIVVEAVEKDHEIKIDIEYRTGLFKKKTVEKFGKNLITILEEIIERPEVKLKEIRVL